MSAHHHDHDHDTGAQTLGDLVSVGIDIGSSTSHLMFSQLRVGYPSLQRRRPEILERRVLGRSPVVLTPFSEDWSIQAEPLKELLEESFRSAGIRREDIDTGAVIVTGEAARRENARKIAELFSDEAGRFVCATAGPRLEAVLAAHGSGAVSLSRERAWTLLNIDIGGGTTKVSLVIEGRIAGATTFNIGARLIAFENDGRLVRLEKSGKPFLAEMNCSPAVGDRIGSDILTPVASRMARLIFDLLAGEPPPWSDIMVMPPLLELPALDGILFSGGVSEYIYERESAGFGDLGSLLGREVKKQAEERDFRILNSGEGIRATVIGASQYSMQISGETIFIPESVTLPLHNLRVLIVQVSWDAPIDERAAGAVRNAVTSMDEEIRGTPFALVFTSPPFYGYGAAQDLARGIRRALLALAPGERPRMLVFEQNIGRVVGEMLAADLSIPCVDEISLDELDFIDIGAKVDGEGYVPVVVKSLAFGV
ncbi:MAG: ethanolamine ammonia-lyase reactivating factor EutA [Deltaproteobacteria bacterium]|nr:ethanolamine ammonia-lyase reactivating factor EutA [Deltaproteobacteria bacterium]